MAFHSIPDHHICIQAARRQKRAVRRPSETSDTELVAPTRASQNVNSGQRVQQLLLLRLMRVLDWFDVDALFRASVCMQGIAAIDGGPTAHCHTVKCILNSQGSPESFRYLPVFYVWAFVTSTETCPPAAWQQLIQEHRLVITRGRKICAVRRKAHTIDITGGVICKRCQFLG